MIFDRDNCVYALYCTNFGMLCRCSYIRSNRKIVNSEKIKKKRKKILVNSLGLLVVGCVVVEWEEQNQSTFLYTGFVDVLSLVSINFQ